MCFPKQAIYWSLLATWIQLGAQWLRYRGPCVRCVLEQVTFILA